MVRICPRSTPAMASSTRKLRWTAEVIPGIGRAAAAVWVVTVWSITAGGVTVWFVAVGDAVASTVPAKIIPARRESRFHCGPRTCSATTCSDCATAKLDRQMFDRRTRATTNTPLDTRIASLFLEGTGPGESWEWNQISALWDQTDVRAVTVHL